MTLTNENYYSKEASLEYMSVSQYKQFCKCEAAAMAQLNGEWEFPMTTAMMVGSYVDAWIEGTLPEFQEKHPEIFNVKLEETPETVDLLKECDPDLITRNDTIKSNKLSEAKQKYPECFKKTFSLKADYVQAEEIIELIKNEEGFKPYLSGKKQVILTAELFGTKWKIKIDDYDEGKKITDWKIMRSMERIMGKSFVEHWGYDLQMAIYGEVVKKLTGLDLETDLAVVTKEEPPDRDVINIPEWRREDILREVERNMPHILSVKAGVTPPERCGVCKYCRATKTITGPIDFELVGLSAAERRAIGV